MPTRNVVLTDEQAAFLDELVKSGRYQNVSEAIRDGVRSIEDQEENRRVVREYFDQLLDEANSGEGIPAEEVFAELRARYFRRDAAE